ncbi:hypothetical protein [Streptomyces sp. NPDC005970]|uniref:hypothetical protein n=1 Tax=Streptomyces sp. NPDC005970 TaxID=3156723 RepID=UPI0033D570FF
MTITDAVITDDAGYAQTVETAVKAAAAYYGGEDSALDDAAYDRLIRAITAWETDNCFDPSAAHGRGRKADLTT